MLKGTKYLLHSHRRRRRHYHRHISELGGQEGEIEQKAGTLLYRFRIRITLSVFFCLPPPQNHRKNTTWKKNQVRRNS